MSQNEELLKLLDRISEGVATEDEIRQYNKWCNDFQDSKAGVPVIDIANKAEMLTEIQKGIKAHEKQRGNQNRLWLKIVAAAAVLVFLVLFGLEYTTRQPDKGQLVQTTPSVIQPGGDKAVLTLSNGQTIILDSAQNGLLATQSGAMIVKSDQGALVYKHDNGAGARGAHDNTLNDQITYNTLSVPRGGKFRLALPDGTKVWLNASSSIKYPTAFTGEERKVAITGEVYMEVAKDAKHPFIVTTRKSEIRVLGTHFNIMAYTNEPAVTTTLLEGSIRLSVPGSKNAVVIKPGQQAVVKNEDVQIDVRKVNTEEVIAWMQDLISLEGCSVEALMNQLSRWYDVDIAYAGKIPRQSLGGVISRKAVLSNVLAALAAAGVHTRVEGKKIIVLPD
ncbi:MAG TPA: FecR domain-containing protein [Arachidicoccus sp.]|nr:FecR domain-containing protein [Arachidicoccus sp.]